MKITSNSSILQPDQTLAPAPANPDLPRKKLAHRKPIRRRSRTPRLAPSGKRIGPPTPLLRWKLDEAGNGEGEGDLVDNVAGDGSERLAAGMDEFGGRRMRRGAKGGEGPVSVRKLGATLWRLQPPELAAGVAGGRRSRKEDDRLGFKRGSSHVDVGSKGFGFEVKGQPRSPCSVNGPTNGYACEPQASFKFANYAMEGATKWDPVRPEKNKEPASFQSYDQKQNDAPMISALQAELEQAQRRIEELESERRSSKKKLKHFLVKLSEERTAWRSREHEKVRAIISDVKSDLTRERKNCQRLEIVNSKLVNELSEVKLVVKRYMQDLEKERKNRELVEEVCDELAKEIGEDKAEVEELKAECMRIREEVDDERKMLQMAEVWREERVQMKLIDAKVTLEDKYSQMNKLIADLRQFVGSNSREMMEVELLQKAADSVKIHDLKEFTYEPPKSDDIFSIFEEMGMGEISPTSHASKSQNNDLDDDRSGWETVSQADDQGSSFSPEGSIASRNRSARRDSNVSGSGTETSDVCSVRSKQLKKVSSISRLWRSLPNNGDNCKIISVNGVNGRLSNGRISNGAGYDLSELPGQWSSPDTGNPNMVRGMKGCIEWPRGPKNSLKAKLLEARVESQKIQLRQVLKQKI